MLRNNNHRKLSTALIASFAGLSLMAVPATGLSNDQMKKGEHVHTGECTCPVDHKDKNKADKVDYKKDKSDKTAATTSANAQRSEDVPHELSESGEQVRPMSDRWVERNEQPASNQSARSFRGETAMNSDNFVESEPLQTHYESEDDFISMVVDDSRLYQADSQWERNRLQSARGYAEAGMTDQPSYIEIDTNESVDYNEGELNVEYDEEEVEAQLNSDGTTSSRTTNINAERSIERNQSGVNSENRRINDPEQLSSPAENPQRDLRVSILVPAPGELSEDDNRSTTSQFGNQPLENERDFTMNRTDRSQDYETFSHELDRDRDVSLNDDISDRELSQNLRNDTGQFTSQQDDDRQSNLTPLTISSVDIESKPIAMFVPADELAKMHEKRSGNRLMETAQGSDETVFIIYMQPETAVPGHTASILNSRPLDDFFASAETGTSAQQRQTNRDVSSVWVERQRQPNQQQDVNANDSTLEDEEFAMDSEY